MIQVIVLKCSEKKSINRNSINGGRVSPSGLDPEFFTTIQGKSLLDSTVTIEAPAYVSDIPTHPTDLNWNHASK